MIAASTAKYGNAVGSSIAVIVAPSIALDRLVKRVKDTNVFTANNAMDELSQIDDDRAAEAIAGQLRVFGRGHHAARNLERMGKRAEKMAHELLANHWVHFLATELVWSSIPKLFIVVGHLVNSNVRWSCGESVERVPAPERRRD